MPLSNQPISPRLSAPGLSAARITCWPARVALPLRCTRSTASAWLGPMRLPPALPAVFGAPRAPPPCLTRICGRHPLHAKPPVIKVAHSYLVQGVSRYRCTARPGSRRTRRRRMGRGTVQWPSEGLLRRSRCSARAGSVPARPWRTGRCTGLWPWPWDVVLRSNAVKAWDILGTNAKATTNSFTFSDDDTVCRTVEVDARSRCTLKVNEHY